MIPPRCCAFILHTRSGQWAVEVWVDGEPFQTVAGIETEMDALEEASCLSLSYSYQHLDMVVMPSARRPDSLGRGV